jgi:hypothetical protein
MDDIVDFSPSTSAADRRPRPSPLALVGLVAALTAGGYYALGLVVAPRPMAALPPTPAVAATATPTTHPARPAPALTISPGAPIAALAAIPVRGTTVASGTAEVMGDATGPVGVAAIAGPGRYIVDLICLGHGVVSVTLGDVGIFLDESMHSPRAPTARLPCGAAATAPLSAEVEIAGTSLAMKFDPNPATVGGIAWRISRA